MNLVNSVIAIFSGFKNSVYKCQAQFMVMSHYLSQSLLKDAELKALEKQINPHFLYNTLDSINWRAKQVGASEISSMAQALGNLLRMTLNDSNTDSTLGNEVNLINAYITIQQIRFDERLIFSMNIDTCFYDLPFPKLILQPIVDNIITHIIDHIIDPLDIKIDALEVQDTLTIYIKINGHSLQENLLEKLMSRQYSSNEHHIPLQNIDERLKLVFGNKFGLNLYNEKNIAITKICIPINNSLTKNN